MQLLILLFIVMVLLGFSVLLTQHHTQVRTSEKNPNNSDAIMPTQKNKKVLKQSK
ncbi:MAG: hypothetical protein NW226_18540 [Microscillaceae bacterium]|nr:hypothetical protein [Microscillaceae bacterium]